MASRTLPGLGLKADWDLGEDGWKPEMDSNLLVLSALVQPRVIDTVSADPGAPAEGDIYFFDETHPTNPNKVAIYDEGTWTYIAAFEGMEIFSVTEGKKYRFDGAVLVDITSGGGGSGVPAGGLTGQVLMKLSNADGDADWQNVIGGGGGGDWTLVDSADAAASANVDLAVDTSQFDEWLLIGHDVVLSGNNDLGLQLGSGGGPAWDTGNNYDFGLEWRYGTAGVGTFSRAFVSATSSLRLGTVAGGASSPSGVSLDFQAQLKYLASGKNARLIGGVGSYDGSGGLTRTLFDGVHVNAAYTTTGLRIVPSAGTITSGKFALYGRIAGSDTGGGSAWALQWGGRDNEAPAASYATLDTRNNRIVLDFDAAADESAVFSGVLPADYGGAGVRVYLYWAASTAVAGDVVWNAALERTDLSSLDIDADSFAAAKAATTTAPGTSGMVVRTQIDFTDGAEMDSLAAGELFRLKITRNADDAADTMAGDAELLRVVMVSQ